ncbi:MAG: polyphosphate:AMP phosphotransferase [Synechococcaceae cyanobacterium SM2_3_2]|nr:polyphosphate:AMP phosphotransferase [Synechococcaceae cyanobacterium SM2_3_2]
MLETLDLSVSLAKSDYKEQIEPLSLRLRNLQQSWWEQKQTLIVVLEGWAAAGKGSLVKRMADTMDPRGFEVNPIWPPTEQERQYPFLWRFWQQLPPQGTVSIFYHSWYTHVLEERLFGRVSEDEVPDLMRQINSFERQLVDGGAVIVKFWIHLSPKELKRRLKKYASDPLDGWRVRTEDWQQHKHYDHYAALAEDMLVHTGTGAAPWSLIEGDNKRWGRIKVLTHLAASMNEQLDRVELAQAQPGSLPTLAPQTTLAAGEPDWLAQVDLDQELKKKAYHQRLRAAQIQLRQYQKAIHDQGIPVLVMFEGWDAAGKGGAIKRLTEVLDPRSYKVRAYSAPTDEEKAHHYLWRFWRYLPSAGRIHIYDRSWYGRVLVERVEGFASELEWRRAYREINEFEEHLVKGGIVLVKIWLHISPAEQLSRFEERQQDPFKRHKLTEEDWRNREQWPLYEVAANQMFQRTQTPLAPWTLVAADDKYHARIQVIEAVSGAIAHHLDQNGK